MTFKNSDQIGGPWIPAIPLSKFGLNWLSVDPCIPFLKFGPIRPSVDLFIAVDPCDPPFKIWTELAVRRSLHPLFKIRTDSAVRGSLHCPLKIRTKSAVRGSLPLSLKIRTKSVVCGPLHYPSKTWTKSAVRGSLRSLYQNLDRFGPPWILASPFSKFGPIRPSVGPCIPPLEIPTDSVVRGSSSDGP